MPIVSIARQHDEKDVNFKISYLKNSVWLEDNGDARVMIHCVIRAVENSDPFSSLRIVVTENVLGSTLKSDSKLLKNEANMEEYEDGDVKFEILDEKDSKIRGNGGEYFVTDVTFGDVSTIGNFTGFSVNLQSPITPEKARGFRIEFVSEKYANKLRNIESYYIGLYDTRIIPTLLRSSDNYAEEDIMEVEYSDLWVVLPRNKRSGVINPIPPTETVDFSAFSTSGYLEWRNKKLHLKERVAYRWRTDKCNHSISGPSIYGEFSSPPLSKWYTYIAIVLAVIGILITTIFSHPIF